MLDQSYVSKVLDQMRLYSKHWTVSLLRNNVNNSAFTREYHEACRLRLMELETESDIERDRR